MSCNRSLGTPVAVLLVVMIVILVFAPAAWAASRFETLHKFSGGADGGAPSAGLILDATGNLYGTTSSGGASGHGTVFQLKPNSDGTWTETVLHSFNLNDGAIPSSDLIFDQVGNLYGTTSLGGNLSGCNDGCGVVFKLTPNPDGSWTESVLHTFTDVPDGRFPNAGLIFDQAGNLYGTTVDGGADGNGTVFKLTPNLDGSWTETVTYNFTGGADGADPYGSLIFNTAGDVYGTAVYGGDVNCFLPYGCGVVFKLDPTGKETVLHTFTGRDGIGPSSALIFDATGNLYGTTGQGGAGGGWGTVFKLTPNLDGSWTERVLHAFAKDPVASPDFHLVFDVAGNLYGNAYIGQYPAMGAVFKLTLGTGGKWAYSLLHVFRGTPALNPVGGLVFDTAGNLYGTTQNCGTGCAGVVFKITP
jgi:uncharacterized repeat protein (TIGR03803 family)